MSGDEQSDKKQLDLSDIAASLRDIKKDNALIHTRLDNIEDSTREREDRSNFRSNFHQIFFLLGCSQFFLIWHCFRKHSSKAMRNDGQEMHVVSFSSFRIYTFRLSMNINTVRYYHNYINCFSSLSKKVIVKPFFRNSAVTNKQAH